ncbi:MAG: hypothetical protein H0Z18_05500 [Thermococcus sp.]|uniref:Rossmann-like domain-containing protein n=1 Tax=Thermococcus sp. TaxID=35749 RepID=UPI001D3F6866|nr:DUF364 domain-containing protein [Thermococcus sp.]MBO8174693.1 hypothetical protein [Thermococcus sp.]
MLLRKFKREALKLAKGLELIDFSFGLPYTYVLVKGEKGRALGVAMTLPEEIQRYENLIEEPSLEEFIKMADSLNIVERTLALAAINAVSQYHINLSNADWIDATELLSDDIEKIAVIGNMPPIVKALRGRNFELYIFERNPKLWDKETLSDSLEYWLLPEMDAVIASATCIVNGTVDMIAERAKNAKIVLLTGPTGQALPELFKGIGITHIASMKVVDIERAIEKLKLGCFRGFSKESRKYTIAVS